MRLADGTKMKTKLAWDTDMRNVDAASKTVNHKLSRIIHDAKTSLPYGEWTELWSSPNRLFAVRKADKLDFVGERLLSLLPLDRAEVCLPIALNTLYALAHLPSQILLRLIDAGRIHRRLKRKAAEALVEEFVPQPRLPLRPLKVRPVMAKILRQLRAVKAHATPADCEFALKRI